MEGNKMTVDRSVKFSLAITGHIEVSNAHYGNQLLIEAVQRILLSLEDSGVIIGCSKISVLAGPIKGWSAEQQAEALRELFSFFADKSQQEIAWIVGLTPASISYFKKDNRRISPRSLGKICRGLENYGAPQELVDAFKVLLKGEFE